jgi:heme/copper-type cytochrome/quinol oxidase subunit 3
VLLLSAVPVMAAARAVRAGKAKAARALLGFSLLVQLGYLAVQITQFRLDFLDFRPSSSAYGSVYFTLVGLHHVHVIVGILLSAAILAKLTKGITPYRETGLRAIAWYWVFVAGVAVPVVFTQISPSL